MNAPPNARPVAPQERLRCACPAWTDARQCIAFRYGHEEEDEPGCECMCHDADDHDEVDDG